MPEIDEYQLRPDVTGYTRDYKLEDNRLIMPPARLSFWREYFDRVLDDQKKPIAVELLAWIIKSLRLSKEMFPSDPSEGEAIVEKPVRETTEIVVALLFPKARLFLNDLGSAVVQSTGGSVAVRDGEIVDASALSKHSGDLTVLSPERAFDRIEERRRLNVQQMQENTTQARRNANSFFRLVLVFAALGFVAIILGIIAMFLGYAAKGAVTTSASIIPGTLSAIFFKKDRELRSSVAEYDAEIRASERFLTAADLAQTIGDTRERDSMKTKIVEAMLKQATPKRPNARNSK